MISYLDKTGCNLHEFYKGKRQAYAGDMDNFLLIPCTSDIHA